MDLERRSLYNSLRINWLHDPSISVEPWQVEDYRIIPLQALFERLALHEIELNRPIFIALAEDVEAPEDLLESMVRDLEVDERSKDQIYLLVFELWRRLLPEKPTLTIFCDELDYQIHEYDFGNSNNYEALQNTLENLQAILEENIDLGIDPKEAFELISSKCANNIEGFLYDFIAELIDENNTVYAKELLEAFEGYLEDSKWFDFLKVQLTSSSDPEAANEMLLKILQQFDPPELELYLEILAYLGPEGDAAMFLNFYKHTLPLIKCEDDFKELLQICADFYRNSRHGDAIDKIEGILLKRSKINSRQAIHPADPDIVELCDVMNFSLKI
jgi:hypothetical protein